MLCAYLVLAVALGGATRSDAAGDTILQLLAVPILLWAACRRHSMPQGMAWPLGFVAAAVVIVVAQLVPLPPAIWTALPLRQLHVDALSVIGQDPGWHPISMSPQLTLVSLLALLPPLAVFLATAQQSHHERRRIVIFLLLAAIVSCGLSLWQVATYAVGADGARPPTDASGFFVNRNHFAAFLALAIVLAGVFALDGIKSLTVEPERVREPVLLTTIGAATLAILILLGTIILARSRAGMALAMVAVVAVAILARMDPRRSSGRTAFGLAILSVVVILLPASQFALYRVMERFGEDPLSDGRAEIAPVVWKTILTLMPFGSGLGTFVPVYKEVEEPSPALMGVYVNRAHNDFLEVVMELGLPALVLMVAFAGWFARRLLVVWRRREQEAPIDSMFARAASIILFLLLAHSLVDFPLRTAALGCIFAAACAMHIPPQSRHGIRHRHSKSESFAQTATPLDADFAAKKTSMGEPEPASVAALDAVAAPAKPVSTPSASYNLDRGRWPDAWQPDRSTSLPEQKATSAGPPSENAAMTSVPAELPRDLKEILKDEKAWPKEWHPNDKKKSDS